MAAAKLSPARSAGTSQPLPGAPRAEAHPGPGVLPARVADRAYALAEQQGVARSIRNAGEGNLGTVIEDAGIFCPERVDVSPGSPGCVPCAPRAGDTDVVR